jgi:hypothetical protein
MHIARQSRNRRFLGVYEITAHQEIRKVRHIAQRQR